MSHRYRAIAWNHDKKLYDLFLTSGIVLYLVTFVAAGLILFPHATAETQIIRALGSCAFLLLHIVLSIGPLARLDRRFLPLLYNRRHLGVATFLVALAHGVFSLVQFHAFGTLHPLVSLFVSNGGYEELADFPFQPIGFAALLILFLMAATSHDFWLANLTAPIWKALHMMVYVAYGLIVLHVALGVLQSESSVLYPALLALGMGWLIVLHVVAGWREWRADRPIAEEPDDDGFVAVCRVGDIQPDRARIFPLAGERVAVFRYEEDGTTRIAAVSNVCQHQNGPLGEGRVIDGCITCPWHGYQYRPDDGCSPEPFTEKIPTFRVRLQGDQILVNPQPLPAGTDADPPAWRPDAETAAGTSPS